MKTKFLSLAGLAACVAALSSCAVYDEYGYYDAPVGGPAYVDGYDYGYAPAYPAYSSVSFFGFGGGYPYRYYGRDYHHHHHDDHYSHRSSPGSRSYASRVARPSSARGSTSVTAPRIPSVSAPRSLSRPSISASPRSGISRPSTSSARPSVRPTPRVESRPSSSSRPTRVTTASSTRSSSSSGSSRDTRRSR